jgi:hypothetical protein
VVADGATWSPATSTWTGQAGQRRRGGAWARNVGAGNRFTDLTPIDENGAQHATRRAGLGLAIDHVLADRGTGACTVWGDDYIGTDPGTLPLDQDFDWTTKPDGEFWIDRADHFAISCELELDLSEP